MKAYTYIIIEQGEGARVETHDIPDDIAGDTELLRDHLCIGSADIILTMQQAIDVAYVITKAATGENNENHN